MTVEDQDLTSSVHAGLGAAASRCADSPHGIGQMSAGLDVLQALGSCNPSACGRFHFYPCSISEMVIGSLKVVAQVDFEKYQWHYASDK